MEKQLFHIGYRGCTTLYYAIEAESEDQIYDMINNGEIPREPQAHMNLFMGSADMDFEMDEDYVHTGPLNNQDVPNKLNKAVVLAAINQSSIRAEASKQHAILNIQAQIDNANKQLLTATKSVTDTIDKLTEQLAELTKD